MPESVRVRFAPSPTGHVHIGNIRAAIFNYLFARHHGGKFLLRVEDTDRERSTQAAVDTLLECMQWLGLDFDETPFYQSTQAPVHLERAQSLIAAGHAYRHTKGDGQVTMFRMPLDVENFKCVRFDSVQEMELHPEHGVRIDYAGLTFHGLSAKGNAVPYEGMALGGYKGLELLAADGRVLFQLDAVASQILSGALVYESTEAVKLRWRRHVVFYHDMVKGELAKPLDSMKDLVLVKSDGAPLFHLANIVDDITQGITHIIRGDDHVENTYRHVLIYEALGCKPPHYAHLPMIVNKAGKPYSKRDGDAYVGDFRTKGYLAETLFNYLCLLGWSPNDGREKISRAESIKIFDVAQVKSTAAQMDMDKLFNLNGLYLAEMDEAQFLAQVSPVVQAQCWWNGDERMLAKAACLLHSRTKLVTQAEGWSYFFTPAVDCAADAASCTKILGKPGVKAGLLSISAELSRADFASIPALQEAVARGSEAAGFAAGKLNQALRYAVTASGGGADLFDTLALLGRDLVLARLADAAALAQ